MLKKRKEDRLEEVYVREAGIEITIHHNPTNQDRLNQQQEKILRELVGEAEEITDPHKPVQSGTSFEFTIEERVGEKQYEFIGRSVSREFNRKIMHDCPFYPCREGTRSAHICSTKNYVHCPAYHRISTEIEKSKDL